jgi:hypothetical protein
MLKADPKAIKLFNIVDVQNEPFFLFVDLELQFKSFGDAIERIGLKLTSTPNAGDKVIRSAAPRSELASSHHKK